MPIFKIGIFVLILDNYSIHKSRLISDWLARHPKFNLLFLPVYSPRLNKIERLWQSLHETVTRNHGCQYMWQLLEKVKTFLNLSSYMICDSQPVYYLYGRNISLVIWTFGYLYWRQRMDFWLMRIVFGLLPWQENISTEGYIFGAISGLVFSWLSKIWVIKRH